MMSTEPWMETQPRANLLCDAGKFPVSLLSLGLSGLIRKVRTSEIVNACTMAWYVAAVTTSRKFHQHPEGFLNFIIFEYKILIK